MKKYFIFTLLLMSICVHQVKAQQEFFGKTNGLTLSGSSNFNYGIIPSVDFYFKDNLIISGSLANYMGVTLWGAGVNFLVNGGYEDSSTKGVVGLSYVSASNLINLIGMNLGIVQLIFKESNFPLSLSAIANFSLNNTILSTPSLDNRQSINFTPAFGYTQAFFAHNPVYPVLGVSYHVILDSSNYPNSEGPLFVHIGVNIKL
jgi:hypothetical protein